jgi:hypothetical protein
MTAPVWQFVTVTLTSHTPSRPGFSSADRSIGDAVKASAEIAQILRILFVMLVSPLSVKL